MAQPEELLVMLKDDLGPVLETYVQEKYLASSDGTYRVYASREMNWLSRPPAIIRVNGEVSAANVDYRNGRVTFSSALESTDVVTAEFWFSPYSDAQLMTFLTAGTRELGSLLGEAIALGEEVSALYEVPIVDLAYRRVFRNLMGVTASYHRWRIDGAEYDRSQITMNYQRTLQQKTTAIEQMVDRLRLTTLVDGSFTTSQGFSDL